MDQELKAYLDELEARVNERTTSLVEELRADVELLGRAMIGTSDSIDLLRAETAWKLEGAQGAVVAAQRSLDSRVHLLEDRAERAHRDIIEAVRKMCIPRQAQQPR